MQGKQHIDFLDILRVFACILVMFVHACEQYYFGPDGGLFLATRRDALWVTAIDSLCRASVPLFVMASAYLLFPLTRPTGEFFRRRLVRVALPFAIWCLVYNAWFGGQWSALLFNFPLATGGHLWFVPMLLGLYLIMPVLSPWAERAGARDVRLALGIWLVTTTFPYLRNLSLAWVGAPSFGAIPHLFGEAPWNAFGTFHYASGFVGYLLLGFWFRKFAPALSWSRTLAVALPLLAVGALAVWAPFYFRLPAADGYPIRGSYAQVVFLETSWEFCSTGVALTVIGYFLILRKISFAGALQNRLIRPLAEASYGTYLIHILLLVALAERIKPALPTPLAIPALALGTFACASVASALLRKIPRLGHALCG